MKEEIAKLWVTALRSGKYRQTIASLKSAKYSNSFCCLGVLCDLFIKHAPGGDKYRWRARAHFIGPDDHIETSWLPHVVQNWAQINSKDGRYKDSDNLNRTLASMNDMGSTFEQIAEIIEQKQEEL